MITKLNTGHYIYIANSSEESFRISVYEKRTEGEEVLEESSIYTWPSYIWRSHLNFIGIVEVEKTKELNRCYKIYQENNKVGVELFIKALDMDLLEDLKRINNRGI